MQAAPAPRKNLVEAKVFSFRALPSHGIGSQVSTSLSVFLHPQWIDGATTAGAQGVVLLYGQGHQLKEGRFVLGTFHSEREYFIDHAKTIVFA
ncbi:hypothetical protein TNCV_3973071 [Trichonephila clavipes]|nr:hypothetical protein TNCV_3973071 [Trichonephila clavipes]